MTPATFFGTRGLDAEGEAIIAARRDAVEAFVAQHLDASIDASDAHTAPEQRPLSAAFAELEERVTRTRSGTSADQVVGRDRWHRDYLAPLAEGLGLRDRAYRSIARSCLNRGWFDRPAGKTLERPELETLLPRVRSAVEGPGGASERAQALLEGGACRDNTRATSVVEAFFLPEVMREQCAMARGVVLSALEFGAIGLLAVSDYPHTPALLHLERHRALIGEISAEPEALLAVLRSDLIALHKAFDRVGAEWIEALRQQDARRRAAKQRSQGDSKRRFNDERLWRDHLLHDRPGGTERAHFRREVLRPWILQRLQYVIAEHRKCELAEAAALRDLLTDAGLPGMIDWRCQGLSSQAQQTLEHTRIQRVLDQHLAGLSAEARREIRRHSDIVHAIFPAAGIDVSLYRLLDEYPNNEYRRNRKRELGLGRGRKRT
jgi:hypothetical protein